MVGPGKLLKKTPLGSGETRQLQEGEAIVTVPLIVGLVIVRVEPLAITIAVSVKQIQIAVGIVQDTSLITTPQTVSF